MPVDVAVEEPRAGVVSEEPNRDVVARVADAHDVADDGVHKVVRRVSGAANHGERMSVQVDGVLVEGGKRWFSALSTTGTREATHRSADGTAGNGQFDTFVWLEAVDTARGKQIRCLLRTAQDLEQDRNGGGLEDDAINEESRAGIVLTFHARFQTYPYQNGERGLLTMTTSKSILISAPPGTGLPGCRTKFQTSKTRKRGSLCEILLREWGREARHKNMLASSIERQAEGIVREDWFQRAAV